MIFAHLNAEQVNIYWPVCREILKKAFRQRLHIHTVDDYYPGVKTGEFQLWVTIDNDKVIGSVVTSVDHGTAASICSILSLAGDRFLEWVDLADKYLTEFSIRNNCIALEYVGRRGFAVLVPEYQEDGIVYVKMIGDNDGKKS